MAIRSSRKIIVDFVCVFVIGAVAGGFLTWGYINWYYNDTHITGFMSRTNDPKALVDRIDKRYVEEYHLTPDELSRIQPLINEMAQHTYQIRHQFAVDILSSFDDYHQKIAAQLTPEHRDDYLKATSDRKQQLSSLLLPDQGSPTQGQK